MALAWEHVRGYDRPRIAQQCDKLAVATYPAMRGGFMHLCADHVEKHMHTPQAAKALDLRDVRTREPYGWGALTK